MLGTTRAPQDVITNDPHADMVLCAGQMLYMAGYSNVVDPVQLDGLAGRTPGRADIYAGAVRLLLESGFRRHSFGDGDLRRAMRQTWPHDAVLLSGELPEHLRKQYLRLPYMRAIRDMRRSEEFEAQLTHASIPATVEHLNGFLEVGACCLVELAHGVGWPVAALVYGRDGDTYRVYHPQAGRLSMTAEDLCPAGYIDLAAWGRQSS